MNQVLLEAKYLGMVSALEGSTLGCWVEGKRWFQKGKTRTVSSLFIAVSLCLNPGFLIWIIFKKIIKSYETKNKFGMSSDTELNK